MESLISELISLIASAMPSLALVDEDYGQLENIDDSDDDRQMYPISFPCVLIDAPETEWSNLAPGVQKGVCTVRLRLCIDCYDDTHYGSDTTGRITERDAMRHELHAVIQNFRPADDGALVRTASRFYTFNHGIKVYEMSYKTTVSEAVVTEKVKVAGRRISLSVLRENR